MKRRPFWLPASNYYVLAFALGLAFFFLLWGILHDGGDEMPWVISGIAFSILATFRLIDLVGLDVMLHVNRNLYATVPNDEEREQFKIAPALEDMGKRGWLGNKAAQGFYKEQRGAGGKEFWPLNLQTMEYAAPTKVRFDLVGKARKIEDLRERLRFIMDNADMDRAGQFLSEVLLKALAYTSRRIPEIADRLVDVDRAMRCGFGHKLGPFEIWDALGVRATVGRMQERGIAVAPSPDRRAAAVRRSARQVSLASRTTGTTESW